MHAFKTLLTFLAFYLVSVSAAPLHRNHRRTCRTRPVVSDVPTSTVSLEVPTSTAEPTSSVLPTTTPEVESTTEAEEATSTVESSSTRKASSTRKPEPSATPSSKPDDDDDDDDDKGTAPTGLLKKLFPISSIKTWTTSSSSDEALPLNDNTLGVTKLLRGLSHDVVTAPDGKKSMKAHYPKGSYTFGHSPEGGFSFYATGPDNFNLENAKEATLSYSVYFEDGFDFQKGGKLPGFYGGNSQEIAASCSGGRRDDRCFSTRFMWRTNGAGELYTYLPPDYSANKALCKVAPESDCNDTYGASVGRGSFYFKPGKRTTIGQRVKLNDVGKENGELELFVEGKSIFKVGGLVYRNSNSGKIRGIQMQTFFGGSDRSWASPKSQNTYFSDISVAVTETF